MAIRTIIPGPPGTGKTFRLVNHYLVKEIKDLNTDPQLMAYLTFSNATVNDAILRISKVVPGTELKYISTLHSMGTREVGINTSEQLLKGKKWNLFKNYSSICRNMNFDSYVDAHGNTVYQDKNLQVINYARAKLISLEEACIELNYHQGTVDVDFVYQVEKDLETFKKKKGMVEFSDMIKLFVERDKCPPLDVVFLDEAQDLNKAQFKMFEYIESRCKRSYVAGDDDQTIYGFQGAEASIFIDLEGTRDDQEQSHRVPRKIHAEAKKILGQIDSRLEKNWYPKDEEGAVFKNINLEEIDYSKGEWLVLATTNKLLEELGEHFYRIGLRVFGKTNKILPKDVLEAYQFWKRVNEGGIIEGSQAQKIYKYLNYNKGHTAYGYSSGKTLANIEMVNLEDLRKNHGLLVSGSWEQLNFNEDTKNYMKTLLKKEDDLTTKPRIELSTIHGAKGRERENIVLCMDYGTESQSEWLSREAYNNPDATHRLFFVGTTRAMKNLYILAPRTSFYYIIGHPII